MDESPPFGKRLLILGAPVTKKNSQVLISVPTKYATADGRRKHRPVAIPSAAFRKWSKDALPELRAQWHAVPADQSVHMRALVYRARRNAGDLLNYLAAVSDLLEEAGVVTNDRLIVNTDGSRLRTDTKHPRVELWLEPFEDAEA